MPIDLPDQRSILHRRFLQAKVELISPITAPLLSPQTSLEQAIKALQAVPLGCALITERNQLLGIFTERDLLVRCASLDQPTLNDTVGNYMTKNPQSIKSNASVARLLHLMSVGGFRHAPVVGPGADQLRLVSSKNFVDFIHRNVTKKLATLPEINVIDDNEVDRAFTQLANALKPSKPITAKPTDSLATVVKQLISSSIGSVVVCDKHSRVLGIFTERDYLTKVALQPEIDLHSLPIKEVMTPQPQTALESSSIANLFNLMSEGGYRHIPIVNITEALTGVISVKNFIHMLTASILGELKAHS